MKKYFVLLSLLFVCSCYAQENIIVRIIDTNLFELNDGQKVKIYGLDIPALNKTDAAVSEMPKEIFEWEKQTIANKMFLIRFVDSEGDVRNIKLFKEAGGAEVNISTWFLTKGYASILPDNEDKSDLIKSEKEAQKNKIGIWKDLNNKETSGKLIPKEKLNELNKRFEKPYLPLLSLSIASFALAWDSFASAKDIQTTVDLFKKLKYDTKDLEASKSRKTVVGISCIAAGIFTAMVAFQDVEIRTDLQSINLSYRF